MTCKCNLVFGFTFAFVSALEVGFTYPTALAAGGAGAVGCWLMYHLYKGWEDE